MTKSAHKYIALSVAFAASVAGVVWLPSEFKVLGTAAPLSRRKRRG